MKNMKHSILILIMPAFISFTAFSQQQQPSPSDTAKSETLKDKWTKHYNEMKIRLDDYAAKLKDDGMKHPDFNEEVEKLNKMMKEYKEEIDKWDNATKDQRAKYSDALKEDINV